MTMLGWFVTALVTLWCLGASAAEPRTIADAPGGDGPVEGEKIRRPYLLRDLRPYSPDSHTALLLHLDGSPADASPAGLAARTQGAGWTERGLFGAALLCDGEQRISFPLQADLTDGFTAECWVWIQRPSDEAERYGLLSAPGEFELFVDARRDRSSRLKAVVHTEEGNFSFGSWIPVCYRRWIHVAAVYDPAERFPLMVLINGTPAHNWRRYKGLPEVRGRLRPGGSAVALAQGFRGIIDEVRVSSRARTSAEIATVWPSGRVEDHEPFRPDAIAGTPSSSGGRAVPPHGWNPAALWLEAAEAVPTFNSIGLYVRYRGDVNADGVCRVRFRKEGRGEWQAGMDLEPCRVDGEFRGSLLNLDPGTSYEIELRVEDPDGRRADGVYPPEPEDLLEPLRLKKRTWREDVPVAEVRRLPAGESAGPLRITARGEPDGWIVYAPPEGESSVITVAGTPQEEAIRFEGAAHVILDRVVVRGGTAQAIHVVDSHHVRIRRCEISHFGEEGRPGEDGRYVDGNGRLITGRSGVRVGLQSRQVVVEDCFIHSPLVTARPWRFGHPTGALGVSMGMAFSPNNVIRNNEIVGSEVLWWLDGVGGEGDPWVCGQPYRDTDINGNLILCAQDDGAELDGGQINVRFWDNRVESYWGGISLCPNLKGPSYVFRNLFIGGDGDRRGGHPFKIANLHLDYGRSICVNNTHVGPHTRGPADGVYTRAPWTHGQIHTTTLHNTLSILRDPYADVSPMDPAGDAQVRGRCDSIFVAPWEGNYRLVEGSPAIDAGTEVPNVTDGYHGRAPDLGALETSPDGARPLPHRPSGLQIYPREVTIRARAGRRAGEEGKHPAHAAEVTLSVPRSAGQRWRAVPVGRWIRCTPAEGETSDRPQKVVIHCAAEAPETGLLRGAVVFRTDAGFNVGLPVRATFVDSQVVGE